MLKKLIYLIFIAATPLPAQQDPAVIKVEAASKSIFSHVHAILDQWDKLVQPAQLATTQKFAAAELKMLSKELKHLKKLKRPSQVERVKLAKTYEAQLLLLNRRWNSIEKKLQKQPQLNQAFLKGNDQLLKVLEAYNVTLEQLVAQDLEQAKVKTLPYSSFAAVFTSGCLFSLKPVMNSAFFASKPLRTTTQFLYSSRRFSEYFSFFNLHILLCSPTQSHAQSEETVS